MRNAFNQSSANKRAAAADILREWGADYSIEASGALRIEGDLCGKGPDDLGLRKKIGRLAGQVLDDASAVIIYNMAEFSEKHSAMQLTGTPPGFESFQQGSPFADRIRKCPNAILVLEEIEKAHPHVLALVDKMLADGELSDERGVTVSLSGIIPVKVSQTVSHAEWRERMQAKIDKVAAAATVLQAPLTVGRALKLQRRAGFFIN